jgi:triosephosphate isomerase (TIM)
MSRPLIAGNWKMNLTVPEGIDYARHLRRELAEYAEALDLLVLPPSVMLWPIAEVLEGSPIVLGAQNAAWEDQGAFTGEISPRMLAGWCPYVLLGHSERRHIFGETDEQINRKVTAALRNRLKVILAVGETLEQFDNNRTEEVINRQVRAGLDGVELTRESDQLDIAYEPVWAIGTGRAATPEYADDVMELIGRLAVQHFSGKGSALRVIYGGSVTPANIRSLMEKPEIDGVLVGGASIKANDFLQIVRASAEVAQSQQV